VSITRLSCASAAEMGIGDDLTTTGTTSDIGRALRFRDLELGVPDIEGADDENSLDREITKSEDRKKTGGHELRQEEKLTSTHFQLRRVSDRVDSVFLSPLDPASASGLWCKQYHLHDTLSSSEISSGSVVEPSHKALDDELW
jgi:hypothetical protein